MRRESALLCRSPGRPTGRTEIGAADSQSLSDAQGLGVPCRTERSRPERWEDVMNGHLVRVSSILLGAGWLIAGAAVFQAQAQPGRVEVRPGPQLQTPPACCVVTAVDVRNGVVTGREPATGRTFQFRVDDPRLVRGLKFGQSVAADFQAQIAWIPPMPNRYRIVTAQAPQPPPCATTTAVAFLKIDGIEGESQDACHKAEIELLSMQTGGSKNFSITVAKKIDKATPRLWSTLLLGQHLPRATITFYASASGVQPGILRYVFTDVIVTSINQAVGPSAAREDVTLIAASMGTYYQPISGNVTLQPTVGPSSFEVFLKVEGVQGGSQDPAHPGESIVSGFTAGARGHPGGGKNQVPPFVIQKGIDSASPRLQLAYLSGQHFQAATVTLRPTGGKDLIHYTLKDVVVSSFSQAVGTTQSEQLSLSFSKFEIVEYAGPGPQLQTPPSCCVVTAVDVRNAVVTARET